MTIDNIIIAALWLVYGNHGPIADYIQNPEHVCFHCFVLMGPGNAFTPQVL